VSGWPNELFEPYAAYVYNVFQSQTEVPLWFEPYLHSAQRRWKRCAHAWVWVDVVGVKPLCVGRMGAWAAGAADWAAAFSRLLAAGLSVAALPSIQTLRLGQRRSLVQQ
jgi:hypothetical protein